MERIFFAVNLSSEVEQVIRDVQAAMEDSPGQIRWGAPDQTHITLKFVGEVEPGRPQVLWRAVEELDLPEAFDIQLNQTGVFPNPRRPRVLWVGIEESPELTALATGIDQRLKSEGIEPESREFHPHITVGRVKGSGLPGETMERFLELDIPEVSMPVQSVVCYKSDLQPSGPVYTALRTVELGR